MQVTQGNCVEYKIPLTTKAISKRKSGRENSNNLLNIEILTMSPNSNNIKIQTMSMVEKHKQDHPLESFESSNVTFYCHCRLEETISLKNYEIV